MPPGRGLCFPGVHASGGLHASRGEGCMPPGRVHASGGVHASRGVVSQHALRQTPPVNRITDTSKNITLATASLRPVKIYGYQMIGKDRG